MSIHSAKFIVVAALASLTFGCDSGSSGPPHHGGPGTGNITISLTDDPWEDVTEMVLHVTGIEMGHADGRVIMLEMAGGGLDVDMMQLQNGVSTILADHAEAPIGQYDWMRLEIDPNQSHINLVSTGGRHGMRMGRDAIDGLEVVHAFEIDPAQHSEFMLDFNIRRGVQRHGTGMMGGEYRLHSAMRMVDIGQSGGLMGAVDPSLVDINNASCDDAPGGNWAYLFPGGTTEPDDIADVDTDGRQGPIASDRIDLDTMTGEHRYHFAYFEPGQYRIAITCSGEWDEIGDDDYPGDPEGRFAFQMFSDPLEVMRGQMRDHYLGP